MEMLSREDVAHAHARRKALGWRDTLIYRVIDEDPREVTCDGLIHTVLELYERLEGKGDG